MGDTQKFGVRGTGSVWEDTCRATAPSPEGSARQAAQPRKDSSVYDTPIEEQIAITVPAIVEEDVFAAVAEQLAENRLRRRERQTGNRYLLQGLLVCGECGYAYYGKPLSISARKGKKRDYAYYRCVGMDAYRFGGQRVCGNKQCRTDLVDQAVWQDVCALLSDPERVRREFESRSRGIRKKAGRPTEQLTRLIGSVRRGITRLIDAYQEGFLERDEFEPRIRVAKERLAKLELEAKAVVDRESQSQDLQTAIGQLRLFASRIQEGLKDADWGTRREILRSLIRKVEIGHDAIRIEYKVGPLPFDRGPNRGESQDCWRAAQPITFESVSALCAGPMVRGGCAAPPARGSVLNSLCGRLRDRGGPRRRRETDHGRLTQAYEQVRLDGSPGEDATHSVPTG